MQVIASSLSRPPAGKTGAATADPPCRECRLRPSPKGLGRAKRRGCGDCVLPSSAPGSGRPRSPAEMPFSGDNLSIPHNDRVDQRRGEVPSFAVSIRGIPKGGRNRNLPPFGVLSLFVHFLFARAKRKWTPPKAKRSVPSHPLHEQRENGRRPGQNRKIQKKKSNVPSAHPRLILRPRDAIIPLHEHPL